MISALLNSLTFSATPAESKNAWASKARFCLGFGGELPFLPVGVSAYRHDSFIAAVTASSCSRSFCGVDGGPSGYDWLADALEYRASLLLCKLAFEVTFNIYPAKRISRFG